MEPLISIVIAVLNGVKTLQRSIDSVAAQTYPNKELLVIDGGSRDESVEIIRANQGHIAYWKSEPDRSLYDAFNKAVERARGDWLYFLGADDYLWDRSVLEKLAPHLRKAYPPSRVVYGRAAFVSSRGEILDYLGEPWERFKRDFLRGRMLPHQAVMHHRTLFEVHGRFDPSFKIGGDYEMLLRELRTNDALFLPDVVVAGYQFGGGSSTPENALKVLHVVRRAQRINGVRPGPSWFFWLAKVYVRFALWGLLGPERAKRILDWGRALAGKSAFWTRT